MMGRPTPMTMTSPFGLGRYAAVTTLLWTPVHSYTVRGRSPPMDSNSETISEATPWGLASGGMRKVSQPGTNRLANLSRLASMSVMTSGEAPEAYATARVMRPMGPAPQMTVGSPIMIGLRSKACRTTLRGSKRAPSAKVRLAGILWRNFAL